MKLKFEHRIALAYLLLGVLWILFSDKILNFLILDPDTVASVQLYKGWFYVLITALLFFFFIKRHLYRLRQSEKNLNEKNVELETAKQELIAKNRALEEANERAEESNKLKTAFLNNISHEFRTPMNSILGFTDMLARSDIDENQKKQYANWVEKSSQQLLDIVTDVIEISQVQQKQIMLHKDICNIEQSLETILKHVEPMIESKGLSLEKSINIPNPWVSTDCHKLSRMIKHLIDNAVKFTHTGGISFACKQVNSRLEFSVADTGIGIPEEVKTHVFEVFRQAEVGATRNYGGSGLGLSLVKAYLDIMGGSIRISSEIGEGTIVHFELPCKIARERELHPGNIMVEQDLSGKTILIVEDEEVNYLYLHELLKSKHLKTYHAGNGKVAVSLIKENPEIDLILMDIKMPVMDGYEATRLIREIDPSIPVISQSAYDPSTDPDHEFLFTDHIGKPIREDALWSLITPYLQNK